MIKVRFLPISITFITVVLHTTLTSPSHHSPLLPSAAGLAVLQVSAPSPGSKTPTPTEQRARFSLSMYGGRGGRNRWRWEEEEEVVEVEGSVWLSAGLYESVTTGTFKPVLLPLLLANFVLISPS